MGLGGTSDCQRSGFELSGLYPVFRGRVKGGVTIGLGGSSGLFTRPSGFGGDFGGVSGLLSWVKRWVYEWDLVALQIANSQDLNSQDFTWLSGGG